MLVTVRRPVSTIVVRLCNPFHLTELCLDCKSDTAVPHSMGLWFAIVLMCDQGTIQVESNLSDLNPRY